MGLRLREDRQDRVWMGPPWEHRRSQSGELPDDLFRVGVQFEDGSKATTLDTGLCGTFVGPPGGVVDYSSGGTIGAVEGEERAEPRVPDSPVLVPGGGGGGMRHWSESLWLWPDVDAAPIRDAAARSRTLWDDG